MGRRLAILTSLAVLVARAKPPRTCAWHRNGTMRSGGKGRDDLARADGIRSESDGQARHQRDFGLQFLRPDTGHLQGLLILNSREPRDGHWLPRLVSESAPPRSREHDVGFLFIHAKRLFRNMKID